MPALALFTILFSLSSALWAEIDFRNVREGESFYSKKSHWRLIRKTLLNVHAPELVLGFEKIQKKTDAGKLCSYSLNEELQATFPDADLEGLILTLRHQDLLDDVSTGILLKANTVKSTDIEEIRETVFSYQDSKVNREILEIIEKSAKNSFKRLCFDEAYLSLYQEILEKKKKVSYGELGAFYRKAHEEGKISNDFYIGLEQARENELEKGGLTLYSYYQKIKTLRLQYPLRDRSEKSEFVTEKVEKNHLTHRQKLFESYSDIQIILMGNIIKKLRERLESPKVEILIYNDTTISETIELEPMERFRFAIKLLRKEMSLLTLNTYFAGKTPDYLDLVTASYEIGIIPASELDEVSKLQEIWSPKKTFWDKANIWIRTFSSAASIIIPPPYGFIPVLVVVIIEATTGQNKDDGAEDPSVLF
jgi:hypothetical protein